MRKINLNHKRFGRLLVIKENGRRRGHVLWKCRCDCGNIIYTIGYDLRRGHTQSCGCISVDRGKKLKGELNPAWKGGRRRNYLGYIEVLSPEHPEANKKGYVLEHRLIMEKKLGRRLEPRETVHHIDGNPQNNSAENLLVMDNYKHLTWHKRLNEIALYD